MRFFLLGSIFALSVACSSSSSGGSAAPSCDDTAVPATAGATCNVPGKYTLTSTPRCGQTACSQDADAPFEIEVTCNGNDCKIEGNRSTAGSSTFFSVPCTLNGCACTYLGNPQPYIFDATGFVGEGEALTNAGDGASCSERTYYKATRL